MNIEKNILLSYNDYMKSKSNFSSVLKIFPNTPQSFSTFPTIICREVNNIDYIDGKTTNNEEYMDSITYQIDIYTKDVQIDNVLYPSNEVISELKTLTANFFRNCNFERTSSTPSDYIDITVNRYILTFNAKLNNWNNKLI